MLEINLLPVREARRAADLKAFGMLLVLAALLGVVAVAGIHIHLVNQISTLETRRAQLKSDIAKFKPQLDQVAEYDRRKAELQKKIDVIEGLDKARSGPVKLMNEISRATPDKLWLLQLDSVKGVVTLKGEAIDNEIVAEFLRKLKDSGIFAEVDLKKTTTKTSQQGGMRVVTFDMTATFPEAAAPAAGAGKPGAPAPPPRKKA